MSESPDSSSCVNAMNSSCLNVVGRDKVCSASSESDNQAAGFSQSRSSLSQLGSASRLSSAGDSSAVLSRTPAEHSTDNSRSKPSVDVQHSMSTSTSDSSNTSRSIECVF